MKVDSKTNVVLSDTSYTKTQADTIAGMHKAKGVVVFEEPTPAVSLEGLVQDDTPIVAKTLKEYVAEFRTGAAKTARATLEMCRTVYEARCTLDVMEFATFCKDIGYRDYSSTIRKFIAIGKVYPHLIAHAEQLPDAWSSIYLITQIPADTFDEYIANGYKLKQLKGKELAALVQETQDRRSIGETVRYDKKAEAFPYGKLCFTRRPDIADWRAMEKALAEIAVRLPIKLVFNKKTREEVQRLRDEAYECAKAKFKGTHSVPGTWDFGIEASAGPKIAKQWDKAAAAAGAKEAEETAAATVAA